MLLLTRLLIWARRLCRPAARWWPWPLTIFSQVELRSQNYDVNHIHDCSYDKHDNCYDDGHDRQQYPFRLDFESCFWTSYHVGHDNILSGCQDPIELWGGRRQRCINKAIRLLKIINKESWWKSFCSFFATWIFQVFLLRGGIKNIFLDALASRKTMLDIK